VSIAGVAWWELTWDDVDPHVHRFDPSLSYDLILPHVPREKPKTYELLDEITAALVARHGRWAVGWRAQRKSGGAPGGWCCVDHSFSTPDQVAKKIGIELADWRRWLEQLARQFAALAPPAPPESDQERARAFEAAAALLVAEVVEETSTDEAWYGHCELVLSWYLQRLGVAPEKATLLVEEAIGGRFKSWTQPTDETVRQVASDFARKSTRLCVP
jgi:hypothetical protein